ncbi:udp-glucose 4-epimerase [Nannochloropsis gaditana]|uniref:UDP-glucose 4-epimerase n=1 Tax=Nannochloropsis gaditana TaxID=72520 RepID=W7TV19_9STRA|nr:udp-glucose 4-epimerase [Nannochloropsis gaditana]
MTTPFMKGLGQYAAPIFMGASLLYALGQKHREDLRKARRDRAHNRILVTGGAGYIGSHTVLLLVEAGYEVVVVDSLVNSCEEALRRVGALTGHPEKVIFCKADLLDEEALESVFATHGGFRACVHFAGLKAVGESVAKPLLYYANNLTGTLHLLNAMHRHGCKIMGAAGRGRGREGRRRESRKCIRCPLC